MVWFVYKKQEYKNKGTRRTPRVTDPVGPLHTGNIGQKLIPGEKNTLNFISLLNFTELSFPLGKSKTLKLWEPPLDFRAVNNRS